MNALGNDAADGNGGNGGGDKQTRDHPSKADRRAPAWYKPPTIKQQAGLVELLKDIDTNREKEEICYLAAGTLLEDEAKFFQQDWLRDYGQLVLSTYFPPAGVTGNVSTKVRATIEVLIPREYKEKEKDRRDVQTVDLTKSEMLFTTVETKREEALWYVISVDPPLKVPKHSEPPYHTFYPQHWAKLKANGLSDGQVYEMWCSQFAHAVPPSRVTPSMHGRYRSQMSLMQQIMLQFPSPSPLQPGVQPKDAVCAPLSYSLARAFLHVIESLLEITLLCQMQPLASGLIGVAIAKYWAGLTAAWHTPNKGLDMYTIWTAARDAPPPQKNGKS